MVYLTKKGYPAQGYPFFSLEDTDFVRREAFRSIRFRSPHGSPEPAADDTDGPRQHGGQQKQSAHRSQSVPVMAAFAPS